MSKIRVLPEILANTIAAGEIVERPASVVKELVENALDAGARAIEIEIGSGGKRLIRVRDDGEGMTADDALLAFEHHATSKIRSADDLRAIATLGFRGEALPAIAAVSRLELRTRPAGGDGAGTEVSIQAGKIRSVKPVAWDRGTELVVRDLFFNLPARKKFLRTSGTESGHVTRLATQYALSRPDVRVRLISEGRAVIDVAPVASVRERTFQLFGERFLDPLVPVEARRGDLHVSGFTSHPREQRTSAHWQFFFVNGRMVRDRVVTSAVRQAYRHVIPATTYPVVLLFLELPCDAVDVNAHPSKLEIRFRDSASVHDLVRESLARAIGGGASVTAYSHRPVEGIPAASGFAAAEAPAGFVPPIGGPAAGRSAPGFAFASGSAAGSVCREALELFGAAPLERAPDASAANAAFAPGGARILGQIHDSYIVAAERDGLVIVDQHAAHERVLYERNADAMLGRGAESQLLVEPLTLELTPAQRVLFETARPELERHGFAIEPFGPSTLLVRSVPAMAREADCRKLLLEIVEGLEVEDRTLDRARLADRIAVNLACRAAIKVNTPLAPEKMQWLLDALARTRVPTHCPHGRPGILRFTLHEIEKNFRRI